ncbi:MAG: TIGR03032 family protein [bacterium]
MTEKKPTQTNTTPQKSKTNLEFDFKSSFSDNFPGILEQLNISLAVTSYQSMRLFFVRSLHQHIDTNFKYFPRPMGIFADHVRLTIGTLNQVLDFSRNDQALQQLQTRDLDKQQNLSRKVLDKQTEEQQKQFIEQQKKDQTEFKKADTLFVPRASLTTGMINIHDIAWGNEGLWVVNSTFSCLSTLSPDYSFVPQWKPHFISDLVPEDRCHLNGMAMKDGKPAFVTTFNTSNDRDSWHKNKAFNGTLMDVEQNKILLKGLAMPHSPRYHEGKVYYCDSARGLVCCYDPDTKQSSEIIKLQGFPRGMSFHGPLMFVGLSQLRASDIHCPAPISKEFNETYCGIYIINLENNSILAYIHFEGDVDQIYDIAVVPDACSPDLIDTNNYHTRHIYDFPPLN